MVIIDTSLSKVDELLHVSYRLRRVAPESAVGGMLLSGLGMAFAAVGMLSPVAGAVAQEVIDLLAVLNALRTARPPSALTDFDVRPHCCQEMVTTTSLEAGPAPQLLRARMRTKYTPGGATASTEVTGPTGATRRFEPPAVDPTSTR